MILTCPECATSYFVDDARIEAGGRTVKCSNCGARWRAMPPGSEEPAAPAPPPPPRPAPPPERAVDELVVEAPSLEAFERRLTPARRDPRGKVLIWLGSAAVAALLIAGAILFRAQIVQMLPASQKAYAGLGMPVSDLAIEKVRADPAFQGGRAVLSVTGQVRNLRDEPAMVPALRVSLLDRFGKPVSTKIARPINAAAPPHAVRHFAIAIVDPPASVHDLEVTFEPKAGVIKAPAASAPVVYPPVAGPQPVDAKPLPPGSPDAASPHP